MSNIQESKKNKSTNCPSIEKEGVCETILVSANKAQQILGLSRHAFEKVIESGELCEETDGTRKGYSIKMLENFMNTKEYSKIKNGIVDPRNALNDLTGKDWLPETKSFFFQRGLGADSPEASIEKQHPAPFSFQDIQHLITFFTKSGALVLDPFGGVGSTAKACELTGRKCVSIELSPKWHGLSLDRLECEVGVGASSHHVFVNGDSCDILPKIPANTFDFVVTSPPYWGILNKTDQKVKKNRIMKNLKTNYSSDTNDLGNIKNYNDFLDILENKIFLECARTLKSGKYMAVIVSDFRDKDNFISFHSDLIQRLNNGLVEPDSVLKLQGTKILLQNHKTLLPYGYPFSYVENIQHQYVLIFRKERRDY